MVLQSQFTDRIFDQDASVVRGDALDASEVLDVLFDGESLKYRILLRTVPQQPPHLLEVLLHIEALDSDLPFRRILPRRKNLKGSRLACAINPQQRKTFPLLQSKRQPLDGTQRLARITRPVALHVDFA